jgi:hypothetical protein
MSTPLYRVDRKTSRAAEHSVQVPPVGHALQLVFAGVFDWTCCFMVKATSEWPMRLLSAFQSIAQRSDEAIRLDDGRVAMLG